MADLAMFNLTGRKAIVTGSGRGIGKAIATTFARAGADVVVCDKTAPDAERTAEELRKLGVKGVPVVCDVRVEEDVVSLFKKTLDELGGLDILVNNAGGVFRSADFTELSSNGWNAMIRLNLNSVYLCCREAGKIMVKARRGSIISTTSTVGIYGGFTNAGYSAAKAGIIGLTKTLALLWAPYNVRVNAVAPGLIETEGGRLVPRPPEETKRRLESVPMGRPGTPEEVAGGFLYLASDAASYVTGITLIIAGGPGSAA